MEFFYCYGYGRLPREDSGKVESDSIKNQRDLIHDYVNRHPEFKLVMEGYDDGYTGTNFDRLHFQEMMAAIEAGKINCVIVKDEGITGTSAAKRPEFLRMIRQCRQKKVDLVLVKSISCFARNTVDCLNYVRALRELGIAILFEEQNINTLESAGELLITLLGAVAQGESESTSENVRWGIRQAMREGRANIQYKRLYAFEKGEDGRLRIIPEQAEVVRRIYDGFLAGQSLRIIKEVLEREGVLTVSGGSDWSIAVIRGYCRTKILRRCPPAENLRQRLHQPQAYPQRGPAPHVPGAEPP